MEVAGLLDEVRRRLSEAVDEQYRQGSMSFFREPIDPWGVRAPQVKRIACVAYREWKRWPPDQRNRFCEQLWKSGKIEEGTITIYLYRRVGRTCGRDEFQLFERWIDRFVRNWANCDGVASWLLAACLANEPALMENLPGWTRSRNRWKRRAAAVSLLQEAKQGRNTRRVLEIADLLLDDADDMVQKGVGWLLKEAYPKKPAQVVKFLALRKGRPSRLLLRYAAEKMTTHDRCLVLE